MYLGYKAGGSKAQIALWQLRRSGKLALHEAPVSELERIEALMQQYQDIPMDLADASLVAAAETLQLSRNLTLDSHFHAFRIDGSKAFDVVP